MVSGGGSASVAQFLDSLRLKINGLSHSDLRDAVYHPARVLGNGNHSQFAQLALMEIAAERKVPTVHLAVAQRLISLDRIRSHPESIHYRRIMGLGLRLAFTLGETPDVFTQCAAIKALSKIGTNATPEQRAVILHHAHSALLQQPTRHHEDLAKQTAYIADDWVHAGVTLSKKEQDGLWAIYASAQKLPDYTAAKCMRRVGHNFYLSPEYRDRYLESFEEIFAMEGVKAGLLQERIADTIPFVALGILQDGNSKQKARLVELVHAMATSGNERVRKQLSHSLECIKAVFPDLTDMCNNMTCDLIREDSVYIDKGLMFGRERACAPDFLTHLADVRQAPGHDFPGEAQFR